MKMMKCERRKRKYKCDNGQLSGGMRPRCTWTSDLAVLDPRKALFDRTFQRYVSTITSIISSVSIFFYFFIVSYCLMFFFFFYLLWKSAYFPLQQNIYVRIAIQKTTLAGFKIVAIYQIFVFLFLPFSFFFSFVENIIDYLLAVVL